MNTNIYLLMIKVNMLSHSVDEINENLEINL